MRVDDQRFNRGIKTLARIIADAYLSDESTDAPKPDSSELTDLCKPGSTCRSATRAITGQAGVQLNEVARDTNSKECEQGG